jgi:hypothetical protein
LENLGNDNSILLKQVLKKQSDRILSGLIWFRIETSGTAFVNAKLNFSTFVNTEINLQFP